MQRERRLSASTTFLAVYTRSKSIDDVRTPMDFYNRKLEKALSAFDAPNQFVMSGVYDLPFGRSRGRAILGDCQLSGIIRVQSGFPATGGGSINNGHDARLGGP